MAYKLFWVLLEGNDDERFFEGMIKPKLSPQYNSIRAWKYAQEPSKRTKNFLKSIKAMNSDYFFLGDINRLPCVTAKKNRIKRKYATTIDVDNIIIVVKEIESWYLAGINERSAKILGIKRFLKNTDNLTKETFEKLMPNRYSDKIDFMQEILKHFDLLTACKRNKSFNYFYKKYLI